VLYGAISQRTSTIRIGHAVVLLPFPYNHPIRVAERVATLDILSNGRVEVGTGRSATQIELGGFGIPYKETRAVGGSARHHHDHLEEQRGHICLQMKDELLHQLQGIRPHRRSRCSRRNFG
jgi:alkanesulfonate monooxygenase SsuD/methylene tetrahydromethanopterin reductase-like flavin-dependent oxidoreductase (luciferase family)